MPSKPFRTLRCAVLLTVIALSAALSSCASTAAGQDGGEADMKVVATTPILGDVAKHIAGPDAHVTTLIPAGKDPHTFEPSLRTVRDIANADVLLANGLLLEPQNLMKSMRESSDVAVTEVADQASTRGATLVPLVENVALDAIWLGLRVRNAPQGSTSCLLYTSPSPRD